MMQSQAGLGARAVVSVWAVVDPVNAGHFAGKDDVRARYVIFVIVLLGILAYSIRVLMCAGFLLGSDGMAAGRTALNPLPSNLISKFDQS